MTDPFRTVYRELSADETAVVGAIKAKCSELHTLLEDIEGVGSRELSLAKTTLEEVAMWAVKHVTR